MDTEKLVVCGGEGPGIDVSISGVNWTSRAKQILELARSGTLPQAHRVNNAGWIIVSHQIYEYHLPPIISLHSPQAMTEFEKLTVVKLREELVKRGLPKTGNKVWIPGLEFLEVFYSVKR